MVFILFLFVCVQLHIVGVCLFVFKCKHKIYVKCLFDTKYLRDRDTANKILKQKKAIKK